MIWKLSHRFRTRNKNTFKFVCRIFSYTNVPLTTGFWTRAYRISTWHWTWDSWQRLENTHFSSQSSSSMQHTYLRKLDTGDTLPFTDISKPTLSSNAIPFSSTSKTGVRMRTGTVISSLHCSRHSLSSSMTGRPSCGLDSSAYR